MQQMRSRRGQALGGVGLLVVWLAGAAAAGAGQPLYPGPDGRPRIDLVWFDPLNALPVSPAGVAGEVQQVFADLGVETTWAAGSPDHPTMPPQINVVFLSAMPSPLLPANLLGVVSAAQHARTVWVVIGNVMRTVGVDPEAGTLTRREAAAVARALGRVVAHEVVHLAAPRLTHTRGGLMQASLDRAALVDGRLRLDTASRRAVLPALARLADPATELEPLTIAG
jgi:hypothetical protein